MTRRDAILTLAALATPAKSEQLPNTGVLDWDDDISMRLMAGAHRFVERKIGDSPRWRQQHWKRDLNSLTAYEKSIVPNRERFRKCIGAADPRVEAGFEFFGGDDNPALVADSNLYRIHQTRWPVLEGVFGEGLLLRQKSESRAFVIALPDADQTPEQAVGLSPGIPEESQFARRLAENGFEVLVPVLVDRSSRWSGTDAVQYTNQTHREWIYRQAYQMGRHIIGYEVQKISAAIDAFAKKNPGDKKIGVAGYAEGALLAFYAAAVDARIDAAFVSAYFGSRQRVWAEPIYRNVWGLLEEFGDAEIATLIAPRGLIVEYARAPQITGHKGDWSTPTFAAASYEFERINMLMQDEQLTLKLGLTPDPNRAGASIADVSSTQRRTEVTMPKKFVRVAGDVFGSEKATRAFAALLDHDAPMPLSSDLPKDQRSTFSEADRQKRQLKQLETHVQALVRGAEQVRENFFLRKALPRSLERAWTMRLDHSTVDPAPFVEAARKYREYFRKEILGQFNDPLLPPNARTRKIYDQEKFTGYEVVLDVWPDVIAWGILLIPKSIAPGEQRPVVVCQHGRRGVPRETVEGDTPYYHDFAARLASEGFVTFSPHNLYRGEDRYRWLDRKANSVKGSMFTFIVAQHEQILRWLKSQPFVDPTRIGFYGLSYGGETAVRVPTVLEGYALSICSGDFNSWTRKIADIDQPFSFMYTIEWEMPYFDMGNTFDYAELAYLMAPRPFMVERGHHDQVGRDQWVAHEYAKVAWLYAQLGLADKTEIEYFNGGHTIHAEGTFAFLRKHLKDKA